MRKVGLTIVFLAIFGLPCLTAHAMDFKSAWDWPLPPRRFGTLSQPQRVQYSKAEDLFKQKNYEAAAVAFEKFIAQNPRSEICSHALLMQAYSLDLAKQRNKAISLYTELLDFYGDSVQDAAPALFLEANARIQNGNVTSGLELLKELVENERYLQHPIADVALLQLASHYLAQNKPDIAEDYLLKVVDIYSEAFLRPDAAAKEARTRLAELYLEEERYDALDALFEKRVPGAGGPLAQALFAYDRAVAALGKMNDDARKSFLRWFAGKDELFSEAGRRGEQLNRIMEFAFRIGEKGEWAKAFEDTVAYCRSVDIEQKPDLYAKLTGKLTEAQRAGWSVDKGWQTLSETVIADSADLSPSAQLSLYNGIIGQMLFHKAAGSPAAGLWDVLVARCVEIYSGMMNPEKDRGFVTLVDRLRSAGSMERAFQVTARIENPALALWKKIELLGQEKKYAEMATACEELEKMGSSDYADRALQTRADIYRNHLGRYEDAIKLYRIINNPPATVWSIIDCYERLGKPQEAVDACSEIEGFFEQDAPRAAFYKAKIWERAGQKDKAIAAARAVLKKYPKHQVSSQAHQLLEKYGIATGGGVMEIEQ